MKKSDLRSGMIVETRGGGFGKVLLNTSQGDVIAGDGADGDKRTWFPFDNSIREDLTYIGNSTYDIIKVWEMESNAAGCSIKDKGRLLWERKEIPEYTVEQLIGLIGHEFKIKK